MQKTINLDGEGVLVEMSADTLRVYRQTFGRDLLNDMLGMGDAIDMEVIENLFYVCASAADPEIPPMHEWLKNFSPLALYIGSTDILAMWNEENKTLSKRKKKPDQ